MLLFVEDGLRRPRKPWTEPLRFFEKYVRQEISLLPPGYPIRKTPGYGKDTAKIRAEIRANVLR